MPGPMFGFSAWAGGLSYTNQGPFIQSLSALGSAVFLFLPGTLFIFLVAPVWPKIKALPWIKPALKGVIAAAAGIILSTAWRLLMAFELSIAPWTLLSVTLFLFIMKKVPIPFIVLFNLGLGLLLF
jgi:chromate transporter